MKKNTKRFRSRTDFEEQVNYFYRLPTELIISIFERIVDAKCLCICYSVCKYFAAHVVQTRSVSMEIPCTIGQSGRFPVWPVGITNFLKKLSYVESATIHFNLPSSSQQISKPSVWWKSDSFGFIFVSADSRHDHDDIKPTRKFTGVDFFSSTRNHISDFKLRLRYIKELLSLLPNLKGISAVDSMKQGRVVMDEQGITSMKNENPAEFLCTKMWIARKVKLPFSGCVMKNVCLLCVGLLAENLLEENEYRQVAMTMMKKRTYSQMTINTSVVGRTIADALYMSLYFLMTLRVWVGI